MENLSPSKDLSVKKMVFKIDDLNKIIRKKYRVAKIYHKDVAIQNGAKKDDLLLSKIENGLGMNTIISDILKIQVVKIFWETNDTVKIEYLEK